MFRNLSLKIPDVGIQRESQLSPLDVVIHDLDENMLLDDVFCSELKKYNPLYEDGENVVDSVNRIRQSRTRSEEEILEDFMVTADSLGLHIDLGDTKVSEKILKNKEIVRKGLEEIKLSIDYEKRHLVGRQKDIETIWNALTQEDYVGVCISGMGGNGKTTLAEHIGIRLAQSGWSFVKIDAREINTLSELIRRILGSFGVIVQFGEGIERLTSQLCSHLEQYKVSSETVLLLDNIDDIHKEWNEMLKFLEDLMIALNNNPDNMIHANVRDSLWK